MSAEETTSGESYERCGRIVAWLLRRRSARKADYQADLALVRMMGMAREEMIERRVEELKNLPIEDAIRNAVAFGYALAGLDTAEADARNNGLEQGKPA